MNYETVYQPFAADVAAACARGTVSSPCPAIRCTKRPRMEAHSCCSLGTGTNIRDLDSSPQWPECETCGRQDLLHLSCNKCASPVCGECVGGLCGVCGADLQRAFRGCDLCGRILRKRGTRQCIHCTETWCFSCIDKVGTCGCGELTEEGFLRPLEEVEAPLALQGRSGPQVPCLSTASSCNLVCMADTASSEPVPRGDGYSCSGVVDGMAAAVEAAMAGPDSRVNQVQQAGEQQVHLNFEYIEDDETGPQCSSTGGGCI